MSRAEPLPAAVDGENAANDEQLQPGNETNLRNAVTASVRRYLAELDGQISTDVYQMVLADRKAPAGGDHGLHT